MEQIDKTFIIQAKKIREDYLRHIENVDFDLGILEDLKNELADILKVNEGRDVPDNEAMELANHIAKRIMEIQDKMQPYLDKKEELQKRSDQLYVAVKDRYPEMSLEEMKKQITNQLER